jgi:5'-3' exonuclease
VEELILESTASQIQSYIDQIQPNCVFIAFDGVAPLAKMEQQRNRRYKSWFESELRHSLGVEHSLFNSCMFTPGTAFMDKLSIFMKKTFLAKDSKIILATPDEPGEGEHKLYAHLRENPMSESQTLAIYGLDADLLMLSLFHLRFCPSMFVFREAPEFMEQIDPSEPLFLDIAKLSRSISSEMNCRAPDPHRTMDYVFLCFLLGNDFLPHFPALNIRTNGIQRLLDVYRGCIGNVQNRYLLSNTSVPNTSYKIVWREVSRLFQVLAKDEHGFILQEYALRKKWDSKTVDSFPKKTMQEKEELLMNTPVLYRAEENYISPKESGWQDRYYRLLFDKDTSKKNICINYLEGLEWVCKYYIEGGTDWKWRYKYHYPPLLDDLAPFVPHGNITFLKNTCQTPCHPYEQLEYVLPPAYKQLIPGNALKTEKSMDWKDLKFRWTFCRYFWESHVLLPEKEE